MREDRETRIDIDCGFFLVCWIDKKKAHSRRAGLNPSFERVEETGITIVSFSP
jgi:hypothetical protein